MKPSVVCIIGNQNSGKTTLIASLVRRLTSQGWRVGTIKHVSHDFELDTKGKDSYRHFHAGAAKTVVVSRKRMGLFVRLNRPLKAEALVREYFHDQDMVLIEGYSDSPYPKIEVHRHGLTELPLYQKRKIRIRALITDRPDMYPGVKTLNRRDLKAITRFVTHHAH